MSIDIFFLLKIQAAVLCVNLGSVTRAVLSSEAVAGAFVLLASTFQVCHPLLYTLLHLISLDSSSHL